MRWNLVTGPASEPVTPEEAEEHCLAQGAGDTAYITALVTKARLIVEHETGRQLITATWEAYLDTFPAEIEIKQKWPIRQINSIEYVDAAGDELTLSSSGYQVDCVSENRPCRIKPAYGMTWPSTRSDTYNAVTLSLTAGYGDADDVPDNAKHVILLLVAEMYAVREPISDRRVSKVPARTIDSLMSMLDRGIYV